MPTLTFWLDVDNTLLANDVVKEKQNQFLLADLGPALTERYWHLYEDVRKKEGLVDIPTTLKYFRAQTTEEELSTATYEHLHSMFDNYPFYDDLYPHALDALAYLNTLGTTVIVSDGDLLYQAEKIMNSALAEAVQGRVLLYVHKQQHLDEIMQRYPAEHFVMIDDKRDILSDIKNVLQQRVTTVFVRQGKYAEMPAPAHFEADINIEHIGDLLHINAEQFLTGISE